MMFKKMISHPAAPEVKAWGRLSRTEKDFLLDWTAPPLKDFPIEIIPIFKAYGKGAKLSYRLKELHAGYLSPLCYRSGSSELRLIIHRPDRRDKHVHAHIIGSLKLDLQAGHIYRKKNTPQNRLARMPQAFLDNLFQGIDPRLSQYLYIQP